MKSAAKLLSFVSLLLLAPACSTFNSKQSAHRAATLAVMERVADWQLANPGKHRLTDWTQGALFAGMMALDPSPPARASARRWCASAKPTSGSSARANITRTTTSSARPTSNCGSARSGREDDRADARTLRRHPRRPARFAHARVTNGRRAKISGRGATPCSWRHPRGLRLSAATGDQRYRRLSP
jgi:hypothetical protein